MEYMRVLSSPIAKGLIADISDSTGFHFIYVNGNMYHKTKKMRIHLSKLHRIIIKYKLQQVNL